MHLPAAQKVQVKVVDGLSAVVAGVDDSAKSVRETLFSGHFCCNEDQMSKKSLVGFECLRLRGDVFLRDQENMRGGNGV